MKKLTIAVIAIMILTASDHVANASHRVSIYQAANQYRDAVREFERQVLRVPYIHRQDERLVDDLEDHTSVLRSAARHPDNSRRFAEAWYKTQALQSQVEAAIFGPSCYPRNQVLEYHWQAVIYRFTVMAEQVECLRLCPRSNRPLTPPAVVPSVYPNFRPFLSVPVPTTVRRHSLESRRDDGFTSTQRLSTSPRSPVTRSIDLRGVRVADVRPVVTTRSTSSLFRSAAVPASNTFAPTPNTFAPTSNTFAPTPNTFAPTPNTFAPNSRMGVSVQRHVTSPSRSSLNRLSMGPSTRGVGANLSRLSH